ncbi:hypothetical protein [Paenibacillus pinistramenti]|uniref:hypothetical protein n=1 Tax=Paenibacillus pinistramenti TaxID=1768003 RepID=UPI00110972F3|nr:hypothetical protein [Paenibacillus pinistramenti]
MRQSTISMPSAWGRNAAHRYFAGDGDTLVVLFPGLAYSCDLPLLHYAAQCALEHRHSVLQLEYGFQSARTSFNPGDLNILLYECKHAVDQIRDKYRQLIFISKSLGTLVAGQIGEMQGGTGVRQLFVTPVDDTLPYIESMECTVIYGTGDPLFSRASVQAAEKAGKALLCPVEGADHALALGSVEESLRVLRETCVLYDRFFAG